ncbi:DnaB-like helicase C-terminal domain-containing protein [Mesorhizobium sp.]|uniref:DnaB-like helicase C-terminal domain-containing protein n=1 Tax=Mesorhizobium sp. TaxID=1871066 RepID=UPI00258D512C|nr:DnaB-like helicase C-terminal domain-containing protein [Mesorhizobium sp.]
MVSAGNHGDIRRGNLVGLMSDSGGGKTSFSLQQCRFAASQGFKSAFFSIEITDEEAALQAAAQQAHISLGRIDAYTLNSKESGDLEREMMTSANLPFYIVGFGECSLSDIRIKAEAMVKSQGLDLIMIDHAKMISLPNPKDIFADRVNALYRGLKAVAKSLNVAIVILIQRNDDWKRRWQTGGIIRPMMGDAYGGSGVKQNLDVWFSLYRPEPLYKELIPQTQREEKRADLIALYERSRGKAQIISHKRRRGEPGRSPEIKFEAEFTLFGSLAEDLPPAFEGFLE